MPEPAPDEVVVSARTLVRAVAEVRKVGQALNDLGQRVTHLETLVKSAGLNGHSDDVRALIELTPELRKRLNDPELNQLTLMVKQAVPTMEKIVQLAPDIIAAIEQSKARQTFWRTLFALFFPKPVRYVLSLILTAAITAGVFLIVNALWLHIHGLPG